MHELWASDLAPLIFVALFAAMGWLGYPIAQAFRRRIEGKTASAEDIAARGDAAAADLPQGVPERT